MERAYRSIKMYGTRWDALQSNPYIACLHRIPASNHNIHLKHARLPYVRIQYHINAKYESSYTNTDTNTQ